MAQKLSPQAVVVSRLAGGHYRLAVTYEVESEALGHALADFAPAVQVIFAQEAAGHDLAQRTANSACSHTNSALEPPARLPESEIRRDSRGRMKLEPFLRELARRGGLDWTDRVGVANAAQKLGWETIGERPEATAAKVLSRLVDEEPSVSWIRRRGGQRSRQYRILPFNESGEEVRRE